ncbi:MAG: lipoyl(octanoyl) transferase LipB [Alistipes sp.]|nr:lipoyl(octanoyl) transferase LipB [Alistipes sp.]
MKASYRNLGLMDYSACWELQRRLFDALLAEKNRQRSGSGDRSASDSAGIVLLVEHPPVYTLGKSGRAENLLVDRAALERSGAQFFHIDRGGDITFHGPGQLVCYPILDLERIGIGLREYIDRLEETVIRTVARFGIAAGRIAGASGVWIEEPGRESGEKTTGTSPAAEDDAGVRSIGKAPRKQQGAPRKICAIGVRSSRYVTMHGFALNVATDLGWFARINPCGFSDRGVTSIARETGREVAMKEVERLLLRELEQQLDIELEK